MSLITVTLIMTTSPAMTTTMTTEASAEGHWRLRKLASIFEAAANKAAVTKPRRTKLRSARGGHGGNGQSGRRRRGTEISFTHVAGFQNATGLH